MTAVVEMVPLEFAAKAANLINLFKTINFEDLDEIIDDDIINDIENDLI